MTDPNSEEERLRDFDKEMLRSAFASLFWAVIADRRKERGGFTLQSIADALGIDKSTVSRWFSGEAPNWELNTVAGIGTALDLEFRLQAIDRSSGKVYTPSGLQVSETATATGPTSPPLTTAAE